MERVLLLNKKGCNCCVKKIGSAFEGIDGVRDFTFYPEEGKIAFNIIDKASIDLAQRALQDLGYPAESLDLKNKPLNQLGCRLKLIHS